MPKPIESAKLIKRGGWIVFFSFIPGILFSIWSVFLVKGGMNFIMAISEDSYERVQSIIKFITTILAVIGTTGGLLGGLTGGLLILIGLIRKSQNK